LRVRAVLVRSRCDFENQVRGLLKIFGLRLGKTGRKGFAKQWPSSWRSKPRPTAGCCQQRPIVLLPPANCERNGSWYTERIAASTAPMNKAAINQSRSSARARAGSVGQRAPDRVNGEIKTR
jgi:hypothetical protein